MKSTILTIVISCILLSLLNGQQLPDHVSGSFMDSRDGITYKTVKIGDQVWMAENLSYLPTVNPPTQKSDTDPHYYVYGYKGSNAREALASIPKSGDFCKVGVLYNWPAALSACPEGWHLASKSEWEQLAEFISSDKGPYKKSFNGWYDVAKHLKSIRGWYNENTMDLSLGGFDDYGFSAIPGGRIFSGFSGIGKEGKWWTSTTNNNQVAHYIFLQDISDTFVTMYGITLGTGHSVRCIKD